MPSGSARQAGRRHPSGPPSLVKPRSARIYKVRTLTGGANRAVPCLPVGIVDEDVARVREATDFIALASEYVALKRVGRQWQGLRPVLAQRSPSLSVNPELGVHPRFSPPPRGGRHSL